MSKPKFELGDEVVHVLEALRMLQKNTAPGVYKIDTVKRCKGGILYMSGETMLSEESICKQEDFKLQVLILLDKYKLAGTIPPKVDKADVILKKGDSVLVWDTGRLTHWAEFIGYLPDGKFKVLVDGEVFCSTWDNCILEGE